MINMDHLDYLLIVAQCGSINQASKKLHLTQQHLSKIIQNLEHDFGAIIFDRNNQGVTLTPLGNDIIDTITKILGEYQALKHHIRLQQENSVPFLKGKFCIHTIPSVWEENSIRKTINTFSSAYPLVNININESAPSEIVQAVIHNPHDLGIITFIAENRKNLHLPDFLQLTIGYTLNANVYAAKDSRFAKQYKTISLKKLSKEPLVLYKPYAGEDTHITELFAQHGHPNIKYTVSNLSTFHDILRLGNALHVGIYISPQNLEKNNLVLIPIRDKVYLSTALVYHKDHSNDPLIKTFSDFFQSQANLR